MKIKILVITAGLFGKPKEREVEIDPAGVSLADVLKKAGVSAKGMQISIDGTPVSEENLHVKDGARIQLQKSNVKPASRPKVQVTERASGS